MDHPKRRTRPSVGFVLLVFALVAGISLGATAALPLGHSAAAAGAPALATSGTHATPAAKETSHSASPAAYPVNSYLRIFDTVAATSYDVYLNGSLSFASVTYPTASGYLPLFPGIWAVTVYPAGSTPVVKNLTYSTSITTAASGYYTLALNGPAAVVTTSLLLTDNNTAAPGASEFNARFFNAGVNGTGPISISATNPVDKTPTVNFTVPHTGSTAAGAVSAYVDDIANQSANVTVVFAYNSAVDFYINNTAFMTNTYTIALVGWSNNTTTTYGPMLVYLLDGAYSGTPTSTHVVNTVVTQETPLTTYTQLPAVFQFSLSTTNASILTTNSQLWLNITDFTTSTVCDSFSLDSAIYNVSGAQVWYRTVPDWGTTAAATWALTLTAGMIVNTTACPNFDKDPMIVTVAGVVTDPMNGTSSSAPTQETSFVYVTPTSMLHASNTPAAPTTFTIYANYTAQYVGRVQLSVYNPVNGLVTFSANLAWTGTTPTTVTWIETVAGAYPYTLSVYTAVGVYNTSGVLNVLPSGSTYYNSTTWVNSTLISGLSSSAAGTILLIVGLLIGMIVAMVVGRMVWGGPKTVPPAQPWAQQPAAAANTCSVCGKSFGTPEELAAHSKSEHGMQ